jgi:hypothetical protein
LAQASRIKAPAKGDSGRYLSIATSNAYGREEVQAIDSDHRLKAHALRLAAGNRPVRVACLGGEQPAREGIASWNRH